MYGEPAEGGARASAQIGHSALKRVQRSPFARGFQALATVGNGFS